VKSGRIKLDKIFLKRDDFADDPILAAVFLGLVPRICRS
jgi:hypothetical protein